LTPAKSIITPGRFLTFILLCLGIVAKEVADIHPDNPFREAEDRLQFAKALDRLKAAQSKNRATFTDFMNPQRGAVFLHQFMKMKISARLYGGYNDAERKMLGFAALYTEDERGDEALSDETFPIIPLTIAYNARFNKQLTHRDFLGAVLGLGLDRCKIGDIRISAKGAVMYTACEVADFIKENLIEVGRATVTATPHADLPDIETPGTQKRITSASLRLDAVVSEALHLSRSKAATLIESEKVFVNWALAKRTHQLVEGDTITVRQVGRLRVDEILGPTKKDRIALKITLY